ncbi:MAG TPA: phosphate ABC transporter substrate-binding protein PstS [Chloroflexota bacterium]|jgi:phosphate transport system substrate-binding protein
MSAPNITRRRLVALFGVSAGSVLLAACGQAATPTQAPAAKPTEAPKPTAAPAAAPTTAAVATKPAGTTPAAGTKPQGIGFIKGPLEGEAKALTGAGATFPAALYSKWHEEYVKLTQVKVNYQSIGSGGGIKSISDQTVDFGATDGPMNDDQLKAAKGGEVLHVPMAMGAVVPTYNVPGVTESLKFTPETISGIYLGAITKWNDAKLVADNPVLKDMTKDITVVYRSDGSGTTYIFTDYLSNVNPDWKSKVGNATSVKWPTGIGGKGNEGVAGEVKQNQFSIGYVELIYALQNKLGVGWVKNQAGKFAEPTLETVTSAAAGIGDKIPPDLRASIVNAPGDGAYPISGFTWLLAYKNVTDKAKAQALTRLMWWSIYDGQKFCADLGYAPLPEAIQGKSAEKILSINVNDQRALPSA